MAALVVLSKPQHQVPFVEVSAPDPLRLIPSQGLLVARRVEERHVSSLVHLVQRVFASSLVSLLLICLEPRRSVLQVSGEDSLGTIDQEERRKACGSARGCPQAPDDRG